MRRAVETVELLFPDAKDKIILADLRENAFGEFEGRKVTELVRMRISSSGWTRRST
jgi:alpha-ribazole phosphatase